MSSLDKTTFDEHLWPNLGPMFDFKETEMFKNGLTDIEKFMTQCKEKITVGALARTFPQHQRILLDVLEHLREVEHEVNYVDYKPMPTVVEVA